MLPDLTVMTTYNSGHIVRDIHVLLLLCDTMAPLDKQVLG